MGLCLNQTKSMGSFSAEIRRESVYISTDSEMYLYPNAGHGNGGTIELLISDIPKVKACIRAIEKHLKSTDATSANDNE